MTHAARSVWVFAIYLFVLGDTLVSVARLAECRLAGLESLDAALAAPIYVRDKVALDVGEQQRLREARAGR